MFSIARTSFLQVLGQIGQHDFKLSIKASMKMMKLKGVAREQGSECGFLYKAFELSKACGAYESGQFKHEELKKKKAHF